MRAFCLALALLACATLTLGPTTAALPNLDPGDTDMGNYTCKPQGGQNFVLWAVYYELNCVREWTAAG